MKKSQIQALREHVTSKLLNDLDLQDHHIQSYNTLVSQWLQHIITNNGTVKTKHSGDDHELSLHNYRFVQNKTLPSSMFRFNTSYVGTVLVDVNYRILDNDGVSIKSNKWTYNLELCDIPVMLYSDVCHCKLGEFEDVSSDYAGCFILKGKLRYIPLVKTFTNNYPIRIWNKTKKKYTIQVRSEHLKRQHRSTSTMELQLDYDKSKKSLTLFTIYTRIPFLTSLIPITIVLLALGSDIPIFEKLIEHHIPSGCGNIDIFKKYLIVIKNGHHGCTDKDSALLFIAKQYNKPLDNNAIIHILKLELLPHLIVPGDDQQTNTRKIEYLAYCCVLIVLMKEGHIKPTDRDHRQYTRIADSGTSIAVLFRMQFISFIKHATMMFRRYLNLNRIIEINNIYNTNRLSQKIISAISTGIWSQKRKGVSHSIVTTNKQTIISQLRRISSSFLNNDGKHVKPRMLHSSVFGYECAAETPEGEGCGLVYALAAFTRVTVDCNFSYITEWMKRKTNSLIIPPDTFHATYNGNMVNSYKVFGPVGEILGYCMNIDLFCCIIIQARRCGDIDPFISLKRDETLKEVRVFCDRGRMIRPFLLIERLFQTWSLIGQNRNNPLSINDFIVNGCMEYLSPIDEDQYKVTFDVNTIIQGESVYTHLEVSDISFVGIIAALAPYFAHNQGPRLVYWTNMSKQAISSERVKPNGSVNTHCLWYGQAPLVQTRTSKLLGMNKIPEGFNVTIILYPHACNQEDALVINKAAIERGLFISDSTRKYSLSKEGVISNSTFTLPDTKSVVGTYLADYSKIQLNGLPHKGTYMKGGDVVIGHTKPLKNISSTANVNLPDHFNSKRRQVKQRDLSVQIRDGEPGYVTHVESIHYQSTTINKVDVCTVRIPEVGDKFSSRHAQKGTIGQIVDPVDLPYSMNTGIIPDVVMSPLGITSRMTIGNIIELVLGKVVALTGDIGHGIDQQDTEIPLEQRWELVKDILLREGFNSSGKETYINGITGEPIQVQVMSGIVSYCRLNHMVSSKMHARSTGPVNPLTRQPNEGRRQGGGMRFGQMESECVVAHSASEILRERTLTAADPFVCYICKQCGYIAEGNQTVEYFFCNYCQTSRYIREVDIAYATKLMTQELNATGVKVKMEIQDDDNI